MAVLMISNYSSLKNIIYKKLLSIAIFGQKDSRFNYLDKQIFLSLSLPKCGRMEIGFG